MLSHITTQHAHSTCLAQHKRKYLLSAEGVYIYMYKLRPPHKTHFIFRSHTAEVLHIMPLSQDVFISSGKDATIRLWKENVIRFYEGHRSCVRKVSKVFNMRNMASYGDDKKIFIWEYTQAIALNSIDVYYTCADIVGTNFGFVTGSYDNKLRMYNMKEGNGELFAVFDMDYYYCRNIIIANEEENVYLFTNFINEIIALDVKERTVVKVLKGNVGECKVNMVVKDYQWVNHEDEHEKNVIAVCDDGCAYVWNCGFLNETAVNTENADEQAEDYEPTIEQYTVDDDDGDNNTEHVVNSEKEVEIDQEALMTESES
jgi:WD40 repeat protein